MAQAVILRIRSAGASQRNPHAAAAWRGKQRAHKRRSNGTWMRGSGRSQPLLRSRIGSHGTKRPNPGLSCRPQRAKTLITETPHIPRAARMNTWRGTQWQTKYADMERDLPGGTLPLTLRGIG
ncbi:Hypothetical predicted protein [Pelobates cultripes]|uniref:Uncharacterized protein n=1 Tax=Pelobates cultripes TaxID=61616 RepID=A0AAD1SEI2_PELCU|nr:Hypothetical predicted protein [Pelobates cultripes]